MTTQIRRDAIVRKLHRGGPTTIDALADKTGASRRTILRDLSALRDQGFIIHSEAGRGGGLQLDPSSIQTTPRLSVNEVFALIVSVSAMHAARALPFSQTADLGLAKIEKALPASKQRDLQRFLERLHIGKLSEHQDLSDIGRADPNLLSVIEAGFLQNWQVKFGYRDRIGNITQRSVEPQAILILAPLWYLTAYDPMREDFRHFRMDRILSPELLEGVGFRQRHMPFDEDVCPFNEMDQRRSTH